METAKVLIAAGGSGGHLIPAQQLAVKLKLKGVAVHFAGKGLKDKPFFSKEFTYTEIAAASLKNPLFFCLQSFKGVLQSIKLLRSYRPNVVVGFGSFHTFPLLLSAKLLRIPLVLFEANTVCGKVNRLFSKGAKIFAAQLPMVHAKPVYVKRFPWDQPKWKKEAGQKPVLLVFGGSQGAQFLNDSFCKVAKKLLEKKISFQVIHITGNEQSIKDVQDRYNQLGISAKVKGYETDMPKAYSSADIVICRSGASSVSEILYFEKPALVLPFPFSSDQHQEHNANFLYQAVGTSVLLQKDANEKTFAETVERVLHNRESLCAKIQKFKENEEEKKSLDELICSLLRESS